MNAKDPTEDKKRPLRYTPFLLALFCFILPFIEVSCRGSKVISLTGMQLVTGADLAQESPSMNQQKPKRMDAEPLIVAVLLCTALAMVFAMTKSSTGKLLASLSGVTGFILMIVAKMKIDADALKAGQGMFTVEYGSGYILTCVLLAAGTVICVLQLKQQNSKEP